jgi:hypothetical protein
MKKEIIHSDVLIQIRKQTLKEMDLPKLKGMTFKKDLKNGVLIISKTKYKKCFDCGKKCMKLYRGPGQKRHEPGKRCWTCHIIIMEQN